LYPKGRQDNLGTREEIAWFFFDANNSWTHFSHPNFSGRQKLSSGKRKYRTVFVQNVRGNFHSLPPLTVEQTKPSMASSAPRVPSPYGNGRPVSFFDCRGETLRQDNDITATPAVYQSCYYRLQLLGSRHEDALV
jgi:hypothetical protein